MLVNTKERLIKKHYEELTNMLLVAEKSIIEAQKEANYHIGAMQSRYDTFKEEAQYLVDAQKIRCNELKSLIHKTSDLIKNISSIKPDNIKEGVCFTLTDGTDQKHFFIIPSGLGGVMNVNDRKYLCVSENAPVIKPFLGKKLNEYADDYEHPLENFYILEIL